MEEAEKYTKLQQDIETFQHLHEVAPAYFARRKHELLEGELRAIEQQLIQARRTGFGLVQPFDRAH